MANSVPPNSLSAEAVFGAVNVSIGTNPSTNPCLPYLQIAGYELWASATNDRTAATKVASSVVPFFVHTATVQQWYWAKTVDASGNASDFYPSTTTSTITATPKTAASLDLSLTAYAIVLPADQAGVVSSFSGASTTAKVLDGAVDVTGSWTISATGSNVTATQAGTTFTLTAASADSGYLDVQAVRSGFPTLTARCTVTKAKAGATGAAGASAQSLRLTASSQVFQVAKTGANSPASITFTAELLGGLAGSPTFTVTGGTATLTGTGLSRTLTFANLGTDTATIQASLSGSVDQITVAKLREGADGTAGTNAVVALLSNEAHTLQAAVDGTVGSFAGASTTITIFEGITATTGSWTLSKADTSCASTLSGSTVTVTSMSADTAFVDITAARSGYTSIVKRFSLAKSREGIAGAAGASAQSLMLTASSQIFTVATAGTAAPTSITFTGTRLGGLTGTITFSVTAGTITLTGTGDTRAAAYSSMSTETATIQATCGGFTDTITVAKVRQGATGSTGSTGAAGADAIIALLSNEAHLLPANAAGTVSSFSGATSTITIYEGATDVSASWTASKVDNGVTSTISGKTVTVSAIAGDQGYIDITAARSGYSSIVKRFTLTKAKQGTTGTTGSTGPRGSKHFYVSGHSSWSDTAANTASNVEGGKMLNDIVTLYNTTNFSQTRFWNGTAWVQISEVIDGNLLISGSVGATQISATYINGVSISASQITSGTLTGRTIQTATSGLRLVMDSPTNTLYCKDSSDNDIAWMGGVSGGVVAGLSLTGATWPGVYGYTSSNAPAINGIAGAAATYYGSLFISSSTDSDGVAIYARIDGSGVAPAIIGAGRAASVNSHGIRGQSGGSGLVGVSTSAGAYAFYKESGGIAPFTGQHDGLLLKTAIDIEPGDIIVDVSVVAKPSVNDAITIVERSSQPNQSTCVGVFVNRNEMGEWAPAGLAEWIDGTNARGEPERRRRRAKKHDALAGAYDLIVMNSLGEGLINVCNEGGDIAAGDLIVTSSKPGKGMRAADGVVRNTTVAKAREGATFQNANQVRQIACIYLCG